MRLTDEAKRVRKLHKSYSDARKRITAAMTETRPGTAVYLQYAKALQELDSKERAEEVALGLSPANLGAMVTTEFIYIAHSPVMPADREQLAILLGERMVKACEGLHYEDADEEARAQLGAEFK